MIYLGNFNVSTEQWDVKNIIEHFLLFFPIKRSCLFCSISAIRRVDTTDRTNYIHANTTPILPSTTWFRVVVCHFWTEPSYVQRCPTGGSAMEVENVMQRWSFAKVWSVRMEMFWRLRLRSIEYIYSSTDIVISENLTCRLQVSELIPYFLFWGLSCCLGHVFLIDDQKIWHWLTVEGSGVDLN